MILITGFFRPVIADNPPVQRALLIGIDKYIQPGKEGRWQNLDGCVNDIVSIKEVLQARFGFAEKNMNLMMNQEASRANILGGFSKLLQESSAGDIAVIYYAGHGSQVKNSASAETDKRDESLVPSDSYTGARDIRDKELAAIFNEFATRKILLTVIFDCCHSGSMGRGPLSNDSPKMRFILPDESFDAKDASNPDPPENNGVLIMSASQDYEFACEQKDENGTAHGAFSIALIQTLTSLPAGSPATDIFASVRAILKYNGKKQEPVLAGTEKRKTQTLFGIDKTALSGKTRVAVIEAGEKGIILQGGYALGIYPDCELSKNNSHGQAICLIVKEIINLNSCVAKVISGNRDDIKPGDLFELKSWCLPENSILKVFIPQSDLEYEQLKSILLIQKQLMDNKYYSMIDDPARTSPTHTVFYEQGNWYIGMPEGKTISLGSEINSEKISRNIPEDSKVYFSIPPTKELRLALTDSYKYSTAVEPVSKSSDAQYFLTGRLVNGSLEYAFVLPNISSQDQAYNMTMPLRTNYFTFSNDQQGIKMITDSLTEYSLRLAKIKAWLTLTGPPDDGAFPFSFYLFNSSTKKIISTNQEVRENDTLGLILVTNTENLSDWDGIKRYLYVFSIDCNGKMQLAFPRNGNVENKMPLTDEAGKPLVQMNLGEKKLFKVTPPLGTDTYIMLETVEAIPDPGVLNQAGIRSRGFNSAAKGNIYNELLNIGATTRGKVITPTDWGIQKVVVKSR